jgi:hypothetical protein
MIITSIKFVIVSLVGLCPFISKSQMRDTAASHFVLEKLIYHSSRCEGPCPAIDLEIDSNYDALLKLDVINAKDEIDIHQSGGFKGKIDPHAYFDLVAILIASNYTELKFPAEYCCDAVVTTIIVYANGKRTKLSSMCPPKEAQKLIAFLHDLSLKANLPPTTQEIQLEQ